MQFKLKKPKHMKKFGVSAGSGHGVIPSPHIGDDSKQQFFLVRPLVAGVKNFCPKEWQIHSLIDEDPTVIIVIGHAKTQVNPYRRVFVKQEEGHSTSSFIRHFTPSCPIISIGISMAACSIC
jgi:hypothetical protein